MLGKGSRLPVLAALLMAGCGGGGGAGDGGAGGSSSGTGPSVTPAEGALLQSPAQLLSTVTAPSLLVELNVAANQQLLGLSGAPVCDVLIYRIQYETVGGANEPTTASGALMVPSGVGSGCTGRVRSSSMPTALQPIGRSP
jgi:hypothetical protein